MKRYIGDYSDFSLHFTENGFLYISSINKKLTYISNSFLKYEN